MADAEAITIFYDACCPLCRQERRRFEWWAGGRVQDLVWRDVTTDAQSLRDKGIDPQMALRSLHVEVENDRFIEGIDAYRLLMRRLPMLRPLAWLMGLPLVKPVLRAVYDGWVARRLKRQGRWCER